MSKHNRLSAHDKFAKVSLHDKAIAKDFFKAHLPEKIKALVDWQTLTLQSGSFIDEDYQANYTDILYRVNIEQQTAYLFVLVEHQSKPDKLMPFRLLNYLCKIWGRHLKQTKKYQCGGLLPLIYPLILYHGRATPYPFSMDLFDLFEQKSLAREILFTHAFPLIDLTVMADDEITCHGYAATMELIQKYIFKRNFMKAIRLLIERDFWPLIAGLDNGNYLLKVIDYALMKGEVDSPQHMLEEIIQTIPEQEEKLMTGAEVLRQEGMQQGMQQGIYQVAKNLLAEGLDISLVMKTTGLAPEVLAKLKKDLG